MLSGLTLHLMQTSPVRRFRLDKNSGLTSVKTQVLVLQVGDFDYNLLSSKFEFKEVGLTGLPSPGPGGQPHGKTRCGDDSCLAFGIWDLSTTRRSGSMVWP